MTNKTILSALFASSVALASGLTALYAHATELTVFKSPSCGCCSEWAERLADQGIQSRMEDYEDLAGLKKTLGIGTDVRSCHTAVSDDGFVFEGHVPARYIEQYLAAPPADSIGLSVPAMPVGSPGMEMGKRFMPYQVLLLNKDGSHSVFAEVNSPADQ